MVGVDVVGDRGDESLEGALLASAAFVDCGEVVLDEDDGAAKEDEGLGVVAQAIVGPVVELVFAAEQGVELVSEGDRLDVRVGMRQRPAARLSAMT